MVLFLLFLSIRAPFFPFFFNATPTTEIYTLSLHDALPIFLERVSHLERAAEALLAIFLQRLERDLRELRIALDRKSTRLNSSHANISYAVFCLKKKNNERQLYPRCKRVRLPLAGSTGKPPT